VVGKIYLKSAGSVVCWWSNFWNLSALEFARVWQNHLEDGFSLLPRTTSNQTSVCAGLSDVLHRSFGAFMASKYARLSTASADAAVVPALRRILKVD